mgnify:CR=1 FL=1
MSAEILQALHEITGCKIRSVYIVWSDLFVVVERMRRQSEFAKQVGFFGGPSIESLSKESDGMIDDTITRSFYMAISTTAIILVDIKMSGLVETLSFHQMTDIVVLHGSVDSTLFSICFEDDNKGHALFKCFRRRELLTDLQVVLSAMVMLQTMQLHSSLLRFSDGGKDGFESEKTRDQLEQLEQQKRAKDLPVAQDAIPIQAEVEAKAVVVANATPSPILPVPPVLQGDSALFELARPLVKSTHVLPPTVHNTWKLCKLSIDDDAASKNDLPEGWKLFKFSDYVFASKSMFKEETHDHDDLHKVGLFTTGTNRRDKTHFTLQFTPPTPIEYESESIEEVALRYCRQVGSQYQSSKILKPPTRYNEKKTQRPNDGEWECVEMHVQTLGCVDTTFSSASVGDRGGGEKVHSSSSSFGFHSGSMMGSGGDSMGSMSSMSSAGKINKSSSRGLLNTSASSTSSNGQGRDVIILIGRRRYLPPTMDQFQDIIIIFRAGIRKWHATEPLLSVPRSIYKSLQPTTIYVSDGMDELCRARTNALLLPPSGFQWYSNVLRLIPSYVSHDVHHFFVSLFHWLKRYNRVEDMSPNLLQKLRNATEEHPNGVLREDIGTPPHEPLYYATSMENNPPGRLKTTDDTIRVDTSISSILSPKVAVEAWKRRCWVYLAALVDGGLDDSLTLETLIHAYKELNDRPTIQTKLSYLLDRFLRLHNYGKIYNGSMTLMQTINKWHPTEYESCLFNPFVLHKMLEFGYIEHLMCVQCDPTRAFYVRFLIRMITWKKQPNQPMMGFNVSKFRLLLCNLLARESNNDMTNARAIPSGVVETKDSSVNTKEKEHHRKKYRLDFYSDVTLTTWLDVLDQGEHGPDGASRIALRQLMDFTDPDPEGENVSSSNDMKERKDHEMSRRVITDRISRRTRTLENIIALIGQKDDLLACMACALLRHLLASKPILRTKLMQMNVLPTLFSVIVPAENVNILVPHVEKEEAKAKIQEAAPPVVDSASETSGGEVGEETDEHKVRVKWNESNIMNNIIKKKTKVSSSENDESIPLRKKLGRHRRFSQRTKTRKKHKNRINPTPFRDLPLIIEAVSLLEVMAFDPKIKRYIHDIKFFPGAPDTTVSVGGVQGQNVPKCFYALALLLYPPMAMILVPESPSVMGKAASVVPLHNNVVRTMTALCRFDQRNKIDMSSATVPLLIALLEKTKSRTLQESLLGCIHSIATEFVNLRGKDQALLNSDELLVVLEKLETTSFAEYASQIKDLIQNST